MQEVLVVLFWLWFAVAVGVYGYRLWRRVTQGPKAARESKAATAQGRVAGTGLTEKPTRGAPPLPDGPLEPRLPTTLANVGPPAGEEGIAPEGANGPGADPTSEPRLPTTAGTDTPRAVDPEEPVATGGSAAPPPPPPVRPTVAESLRGIDLPCELVPVVEDGDEAVTSGHKVTFTTREATVRTVVAAMADELERLGYEVADQPVGDGGEHRLRATRVDTTIDLSIRLDEAGAVAVAAVT